MDLQKIREQLIVAATAKGGQPSTQQWKNFYESETDIERLRALFNAKDAEGGWVVPRDSIEFNVFRELMRDRLDLHFTPRHQRKVCPNCFNEECTCGEGWRSRSQR